MVIKTEEELIDQMTTPSAEVVEAVSKLDGPVMIFGHCGKDGTDFGRVAVARWRR